MKVTVLQHVSFEGLGSIQAWLNARSAIINTLRFYEAAVAFPAVDTVDLIIAMGGPMSINDEAQYPWLVQEKEFIRAAIQCGTPVIGICLGAQLIASALGARVYANREKEIGWFPIQAVATPANTFHFPVSQQVFHWHGETFDLPAGAVRLASSVGCDNQAFQIGSNVIGLQFHLETTAATADLILQHCGNELISATYIQSEAAIRNEPETSYAVTNQLMAAILSYITAPSSHSRSI